MIRPEHIEALLGSDADDATLIVTVGTVVVVPASALDSERYRGALEIISRHDLVTRLGTSAPSRRDLEETAAGLDTAVTRLGA
ncbi:hypothetical protein [Streptomyces cahuitamycinicus]|uniref:Uncharacterized protein n=1 Tax=Streptomyces cahuitamycinicus TaxID=2070367 RepID=A0A2N8TSN2_9ACTN|nr:hypothetical protein [Streptomyces cahuitamycinicus]PNG21993.1 hypothetical protein C1J00_11905 [Streptomyces cahuitamycinicus]